MTLRASQWQSFDFAGQQFRMLADRALFWPRHGALIVADLHLEKASWYAAHGQPLPPYDSHDTLDRLATAQDYHIGVVTSDTYLHNDTGCTAIGSLVTRTGGPQSSNRLCGPFDGSGRYLTSTDAKLGDILRVDITVHDPRVFTEPGRGWVTFHRSPPGTRVGGYNCSEQLWDNYVDKRRAEVEGRTHDGPEVTRTHEGSLTR